MMIAGIGTLFSPTYGFISKKFISKNTRIDSALFLISLNWLQVERNHKNLSMAPIVLSTMLTQWLDWIYSTAPIVSSTMLTWWLDWIYTQINDFICVDWFLSWEEKRIETVLFYCNDCENVRALYCVHSRALYCMFNCYVWALCLNWIVS